MVIKGVVKRVLSREFKSKDDKIIKVYGIIVESKYESFYCETTDIPYDIKDKKVTIFCNAKARIVRDDLVFNTIHFKPENLKLME